MGEIHSSCHPDKCKEKTSCECPYPESCPYMDGESPENVLAEINNLRKRAVSLEATLSLLEVEKCSLKEKRESLEREKKSLEEILRLVRQ